MWGYVGVVPKISASAYFTLRQVCVEAAGAWALVSEEVGILEAAHSLHHSNSVPQGICEKVYSYPRLEVIACKMASVMA